jgi:hypothetical protein
MPLAPNQKGPDSGELSKPKETGDASIIPQENPVATPVFQNNFPDEIVMEARYYAHVAFERYRMNEFSHRDFIRHASRKYQENVDLVIGTDPPGLFQQWDAMGLVKYQVIRLPNGSRKSTCCFINAPPMVAIPVDTTKNLGPVYEKFLDSLRDTNTGNGKQSLQVIINNLIRFVFYSHINKREELVHEWFFNEKKKTGATMPRSCVGGYLNEDRAYETAFLKLCEYFPEGLEFSDTWK